MGHCKQFSSEWDTSISVLAPAQERGRFSDLVRRMGPEQAKPFERSRIDLIGELSRIILQRRELRHDGPSVALGFWLRPANIIMLANQFERWASSNQNTLAVPAGIVFHVAPSNVDTMFLLSWAISFLCGNRNIVRLSRDINPIVGYLVECLNEIMTCTSRLSVQQSVYSVCA